MTIQEQVKEVEAKIEDLRFKLAVEEAVLKRLKAVNGEQPLVQSQNTRPISHGSIASHVQTILATSDRPLTIAEICRALKERGVSSNAKTGLRALIASAVTRRDDLFARIDRGVYDLKSRQSEPEAEENKPEQQE